MKYPEDYINKVICGDFLEVMKGIPDKSVDLVLTDPPYNAKNIGPNQRVYEGQKMQLSPLEYIYFCEEWFDEALRISKALVFTPGISNVTFYPPPTWIVNWRKPAAVSFNRMGGYNCWEPIMIYGKPKKRIGQDEVTINTLNFKKGPENKHPCPKVPDLWRWILDKFTVEGDIVCDFFNGSGTTSLTCKQMNLFYITSDHIKTYCEIAEKRLAQDYLFT